MSLLYSVILVSVCLSVCYAVCFKFLCYKSQERFQDVTVCPEMCLLQRVKVLRVTGVNSVRINCSFHWSLHSSHKYGSVGLRCADCRIHGTGIIRTYLTTPIQPGKNVPQYHHAATTSVVCTVKHSSAAKRIVPYHHGAKTTSVVCNETFSSN
jgi:hypothetical protein